MDLQIDKLNGKVAYNDVEHMYWDVDDNSKYISVTTLIGTFEQEFDKDFWSKYKALEKLMSPDEWKLEKKGLLDTHKIKDELLESYGINKNTFLSVQQDILDEWQVENNLSCERGTKIHSDLENSMYSVKHNISLAKYEIGGKFECIKGQTELTLENGIYPEYLISWKDKEGYIRLAGQIDLLIIKGKSIIIGDYKTNKEIKTKSFFDSRTKKNIMMKYPLSNLMDTNYYHYNMQLSTYAWMMQKRLPGYDVEDLVMIHFDHNDKMTVYHLPYLKKEVELMLKFYKHQHIRDLQNKRIKPIAY